MIGTLSLYAIALYRQSGVTTIDVGLVATFSLAAGFLIRDLGKTLLGFIATFAATPISLLLLSLAPVSAGGFSNPIAVGFFQSLWIVILFDAFFPIPLIMYLVASLIGSLLGERLL